MLKLLVAIDGSPVTSVLRSSWFLVVVVVGILLLGVLLVSTFRNYGSKPDYVDGIVKRAQSVEAPVPDSVGAAMPAWRGPTALWQTMTHDRPRAGRHSAQYIKNHEVTVYYGIQGNYDTTVRALANIGWDRG